MGGKKGTQDSEMGGVKGGGVEEKETDNDKVPSRSDVSLILYLLSLAITLFHHKLYYMYVTLKDSGQ